MENFNVIIAGGRDFKDYKLLKFKCDYYLQNKKNINILSGAAKGADLLGEQYAIENNLKLSKFPAMWDKFGKSAGYIRNGDMANCADALIAFWDGKSKGTKHMIDIAKNKNLLVRVVNY